MGSLFADVLPQVVCALQAVDPDERGAALNQLAQVRAHRGRELCEWCGHRSAL